MKIKMCEFLVCKLYLNKAVNLKYYVIDFL